MEDMPLPKGMKKLPDEYEIPLQETGETMTHEEFNYSSLIRKVLLDLEGKGVIVTVKRIEMLEQENAPAVMSLVLEVRKADD